MRHLQISGRRLPIYRDAGFVFDTIEDAQKAFEDENTDPQISPHFIYSRYGNPNVAETEKQIAKLEGNGCKWALLTSSGMSAIDTWLSIFQKREDTGPWLFFSELYGGTNTYIESVLRARTDEFRCPFVGPGQVIVDNTFATSLTWRPLESGADLVIHSATKYLGGHGNLTAGVICGRDLEIRRTP